MSSKYSVSQLFIHIVICEPAEERYLRNFNWPFNSFVYIALLRWWRW